MKISAIFLIIFACLIFILLVLFFGFFLTKRVFLNQNYKLKQKYNSLIINPIQHNISSIEVLVNNNDQLEPLLNYLNKTKENIDQELIKIKCQLQELNKFINTYQLTKIFKEQKRIKNNLEKVNCQQKAILDLSLNTNSYTNYCSNLAIEIFDLLYLFDDFLKATKIPAYYPEIKKLIELKEEINKNNILINEQLNYINSKEINKILVKQCICLKTYNDLIKQIFNSEKFFYVFSLFVNKLENQIANYPNDELKKQAEKIIKNQNLIKDRFKDYIYNNEFDCANKMIVLDLKQIDQIRNELNMQSKVNVFINKYQDLINQIINSYCAILKNNKFNDMYREMMKEFSSDELISNSLKENLDLINLINERIVVYQKDNNYSIKKIDNALNILRMINDFKQKSFELFNLIKNVNLNYVNYTFVLNELKLKFYYLIKNIKKYINTKKINEDENYNKLCSLSDQNDKYYKELTDNFSNVNLKELDNFIDEANKTIQLISIFIRDHIYICEVTKKMLMFLNNYVNDKNIIVFNEINDSFKRKDYDRTLDLMLNFYKQLNNKKEHYKKFRKDNHAVS